MIRILNHWGSTKLDTGEMCHFKLGQNIDGDVYSVQFLKIVENEATPVRCGCF